MADKCIPERKNGMSKDKKHAGSFRHKFIRNGSSV